ncbi:hypothetical protein ABZY81_38915 [Streptomyces sp. NPDC006514]|uniref:hypothetical protein n=1 Tax=Streptomyces sp. NPDC006514 TaxID=3154308 RepID=UPI00339E88DE
MSPHSSDLLLRRACAQYLYLRQRAIPRTASGTIQLDWAGSQQQDFQAMLVTCLMSTSDTPHAFEHPKKSCISSASGYFNAIASRAEGLEILTNTACRIASRLMPVLYDQDRIAGVPGLRFLSHTSHRVRLVHLPTGARLDLIDSSPSKDRTRRDMRREFLRETKWHDQPHIERLWDKVDLTAAEDAHKHHWARRTCTPLRSALLVRAMPIWYKFDLYPTLLPPAPGQQHYQLVWDTDAHHPDADQVGELLSQSPIRIPHAHYQPFTPDTGLLTLKDSGLLLTAVPAG